MSSANCRECKAAGLDPKEVERIARGLSRYGKAASDLGLTVFGGSGTGLLHTSDGLVVASMRHGWFDGGDGAAREDKNGLLRSESYFEDGGE